MPRVPRTTRSLLLALGMPDFNAGSCLIVMMQAPHATDPDMPPVILITRQLQLALNQMGAGIPVSGQLDQPTDDYLRVLCGDGYLTRPWYQVCESVISALNRGVKFSPDQPNNGALEQQAVGGFGEGIPGLDIFVEGWQQGSVLVIGGTALAGYLLYKHFTKGKKR